MRVDPLADQFAPYSPYNYCLNNPVLLIDPDGRSPIRGVITIGRIGVRAIKMHRRYGKIEGGVKELVKAEGRSFMRDVKTLFGKGVRFGKRLEALVDVVIGTDLNKGPAGTIEVELPEGQILKSEKNGVEGYAPDRELPRKENGEPDATADGAEGAHTQLGTKNGREGKYKQAREFDAEGNPKKDIDFTDHGRPDTHSNPHQHEWIPNETGGTPKRGKQEPLKIDD